MINHLTSLIANPTRPQISGPGHGSLLTHGQQSSTLSLRIPDFSKIIGGHASTVFWFLIVLIGWSVGYEMLKIQMSADVSARPNFLIGFRFAVAGLVLLFWGVLKGERLSLPKKGWGLLILQALFLFVFQYVGMYQAAAQLSAPMVAVLFSTTALINLPLAWVLFGQRPDWRVTLAGIGGFIGLVGVLWPSLSGAGISSGSSSALLPAILIGLGGTMSLSFGALVQVPLAKINKTFGGAPVVLTTAVAMCFGATTMFTWAWYSGESFDLAGLQSSWWMSAGGLAIFSSALPFLGFLILVDKIGVGKASYTMLLAPVLSFALSQLLASAEPWKLIQISGLALLFFGNAVLVRA